MALVEQKKSGPHTEKERRLRRERVAEYYFERGFSAITISRMLNVNRNTITSDLKHCYSQLRNENDNFDPEIICMTQFHRMQIQRGRYVDLLQKDLEFKDRLTLEKMLSDIENRIMQSALKIKTSTESVQEYAIGVFNYWAKQQNPTFRGYVRNAWTRVSVGAQEKIDKIIEDDRKNTRGFTHLKSL